MINTICFRFDIIRLRKFFSICSPAVLTKRIKVHGVDCQCFTIDKKIVLKSCTFMMESQWIYIFSSVFERDSILLMSKYLYIYFFLVYWGILWVHAYINRERFIYLLFIFIYKFNYNPSPPTKVAQKMVFPQKA